VYAAREESPRARYRAGGACPHGDLWFLLGPHTHFLAGRHIVQWRPLRASIALSGKSWGELPYGHMHSGSAYASCWPNWAFN